MKKRDETRGKKIWKNELDIIEIYEITRNDVKGNPREKLTISKKKRERENVKSKIMNEFSSISYFYLAYSLRSLFAS